MTARPDPRQFDMFAVALAPTQQDGAEHFELPILRKGWQGMPLAEIDLAFHDGGWRERSAVCLPGGSGHASPFYRTYPSRSSALCRAIGRIQRHASGDTVDERRVRAWLNTLS